MNIGLLLDWSSIAYVNQEKMDFPAVALYYLLNRISAKNCLTKYDARATFSAYSCFYYFDIILPQAVDHPELAYKYSLSIFTQPDETDRNEQS